jgi:hypothetical protein
LIFDLHCAQFLAELLDHEQIDKFAKTIVGNKKIGALGSARGFALSHS